MISDLLARKYPLTLEEWYLILEGIRLQMVLNLAKKSKWLDFLPTLGSTRLLLSEGSSGNLRLCDCKEGAHFTFSNVEGVKSDACNKLLWLKGIFATDRRAVDGPMSGERFFFGLTEYAQWVHGTLTIELTQPPNGENFERCLKLNVDGCDVETIMSAHGLEPKSTMLPRYVVSALSVGFTNVHDYITRSVEIMQEEILDDLEYVHQTVRRTFSKEYRMETHRVADWTRFKCFNHICRIRRVELRNDCAFKVDVLVGPDEHFCTKCAYVGKQNPCPVCRRALFAE